MNKKSKTDFAVKRDERQVVMERLFKTSRENLFRALVDPKLVPDWWGPSEYTTTVETMDSRPEGKWRFVQRDSKGQEFGFHGRYLVMAPPYIIEQTFNFEGIPAGHESVETISLEEADGGTKMTSVARFATVEDLDGMVSSGMETGAIESWERLAALVEKSR